MKKNIKTAGAKVPGLFVAVFILLNLYSCKPRLDALNPNAGPPGTLVKVDGDVFLASVKWDKGTGTETTLPSSFLGGTFFTVPMGASVGSHPVGLYGGNAYSDNTIPFNVTNGVMRPAPRIDDITCSGFAIDANNKASFALFVHAANADAGAKILINGVEKTTYFWRGLGNQANMESTMPATLGYPIFHYGTLVCVIENTDNISAGSAINNITIKNLDGVASINSINYAVAANMDVLDSDDDGLPDTWERNGVDVNGDGTIDIDLPALGADPMHKDLFVEVDWMAGLAPDPGLWAAVENTFSNAPVLNSDGTSGIVVHLDHGQAGAGGGGGTVIAFSNATRYDNLSPFPSGSAQTCTNFYTLKNANFNANRLRVYRYCIFVNDNGSQLGSSGQAEAIWGNDFFVSLGSGWGADGLRLDFQTGTFLHELGHTLNLFHGGNENVNSKDNYNSIMQYGNGWITIGGRNETASPSQFGGVDNDCNINDVDNIYTYSQGMRRDLNESSLNETAGICDNIARDFNGNGNATETSVSVNLDTNSSLTTIHDFADWGNIELNFTKTGSNWGSN
ncbi:MAG: hypothetical protein ABI861_09335 [Panacibacter sp.]